MAYLTAGVRISVFLTLGALVTSLAIPSAQSAPPAKAGLDASTYITLADATQFLGHGASVTRKSSMGGAYPIGMCLYGAGVGKSLQVVVQKNVGMATFRMSLAKGAVPVKGAGEAAYFTKETPGGLDSSQFDALRHGVKIHLYTRIKTTQTAMAVVAMHALKRIP